MEAKQILEQPEMRQVALALERRPHETHLEHTDRLARVLHYMVGHLGCLAFPNPYNLADECAPKSSAREAKASLKAMAQFANDLASLHAEQEQQSGAV